MRLVEGGAGGRRAGPACGPARRGAAPAARRSCRRGRRGRPGWRPSPWRSGRSRSALYLASSFSSSVTLALTMAMLSFIRGTWSFMSRMFCSRISSGSSATEMKNPKNERTIRDRRLNMTSTPPSAATAGVSSGLALAPRRGRGGDRVFGHEIGYGVGDPLFLLLFLKPPAAERSLSLATSSLLACMRARFAEHAVRFRLDLLVFLGLARLPAVPGPAAARARRCPGRGRAARRPR